MRYLLLVLGLLIFFAVPAMADDTVVVTVTVTETRALDCTIGDLSINLDTQAEIDAGYATWMDQNDIDYWTNDSESDDIQAKRTAGTFPGDWNIYVDTNGDFAEAALTTAWANFVTGVSGSSSVVNVDFKVAGWDWGDTPGSYAADVLFQIVD